MNLNFSSAIGDLLVHFYTHHQIAITEPEVWLINNILMATDDMFDGFDMIADITGIAMDSTDHAAIIKYKTAIEILSIAKHPFGVTGRMWLN
jgi:hypothetical protein